MESPTEWVRMRNTDQLCSESETIKTPRESTTSPKLGRVPAESRMAFDNGPVGTNHAISKGTAMTALLLGLLPGILNAIIRENGHWTETCVALSVSIWLYYSLKVPWDTFMRSRDSSAPLSSRERYYLLFSFMTPAVGAYVVWVLQMHYKDGLILRHFSIPMFLVGALMRPVMHLLSIVEIEAGNDPNRALLHRIEALESEMLLLRSLKITVPAERSSDPPCEQQKNLDTIVVERLQALDKRMVTMEGVIRARLARRPDQPQSLVMRILYPLVLLFAWPILALRKMIS